jgi:hypothetical protein
MLQSIVKAVVLSAGMGLVIGSARGADTRPTVKAPFTVSEKTTGIIKPLRADGTPDYIAAANAAMSAGVTPANNGFVAWLKIAGVDVLPTETRAQVLKMCGAQINGGVAVGWESYDKDLRNRGLTGDALDKAKQSMEKAGLAEWTEAQHPELGAYLKLRDKQLTAAAGAVGMDHWWEPRVSIDGQSVMGVMLPCLSS